MICEECGARLDEGRRCRDYFTDLLAREWEVPGGPGKLAHFLAVASYNLQHPSLFTGAMLADLRKTLTDVLARSATIGDALERARRARDGAPRVARRPDDPARRPEGWPSRWPMTVRDVCNAPPDRYLDLVHAWASAVSSSLGNTPSVNDQQG